MDKLAVVFGAVLLVVVSANPVEKNALDIIAKINSGNGTWEAGLSDVALLSDEEFVKLLGTIPSTSNSDNNVATIEAALNIPATFDARNRWPLCESLIGSIKNQGKCGSCWAVSTATSAGDRLCIASKSLIKVNLSAQDLLTCCEKCTARGKCKGGDPLKGWQYIKSTGIVTGGGYNSDEGCVPYSFPPTGDTRSSDSSETCETNCTNKDYALTYELDKHKGTSAYLLPKDVAKIQTEIMNKGPIVAGFDVYEDFKVYKKGVYEHRSGARRGGHAVKVVGWGVEKGVDYWLVLNSWGANWGDEGTFKIKRGTNHCRFESYLTAGEMAV